MTTVDQFLNKLVQGESLTSFEARAALNELTKETATPVYIAAFLSALTTKGESSEEIVGFIQAMREQMIKVTAPRDAIDVCGTGGDGKGLFNISTAVAIVAAACGVPVAKHGNRAASSTTGSADVLEELGVKIDLKAQDAEKVLQKVGMVLLFAPLFHPSMKAVGQVRKELRIRTVFNLLGPFANPARVTRQIIGVPTREIAERLYQVAKNLDYQSLAIVTSDDGLDELSIAAPSQAFIMRDGKSELMLIDPREYGFNYSNLEAIRVANAKESAGIIKEILDGKNGPARDIVVFNTALALLIAGKTQTLADGITRASEVIIKREAQLLLEHLRKETKKYAR